MHGIRKSSIKQLTPEEQKKQQDKIDIYKSVLAQTLQFRKGECDRKPDDIQILKLTSNILRLNADFAIIWNYRRELINQVIDKESEENRKRLEEEIAQSELSITKEALSKNPKSYPTWFHRQWIVDRGHCNLKHELTLCEKLLNLDERNFHCWNYRRHLVKLMGIDPLEDLSFSDEKINQNFSNYSAFHSRSLLLPSPMPLDLIKSEIEKVQHAVFTEPDDQSAWFYYRWIVQQIFLLEDTEYSTMKDLYKGEVDWLNELVEIEEDGKWIWVMLAYVHSIMTKHMQQRSLNGETMESNSIYIDKAITCFKKAIELDSDHKNMYEDQMKVTLSYRF